VGQKFGEFTRFEHLAKKVWQMNRFNQKVIIVSRNLDGFSLANQGWFAKFAKLSPCQTFPLYTALASYVYFYLIFIHCSQLYILIYRIPRFMMSPTVHNLGFTHTINYIATEVAISYYI